MDWIRRNWPDLLIGFALLAVISGIVATLLTGGSFLPLGRGNQPASVTPGTATQTAPAPEQPALPAGPQAPAAQPDNEISELPLIGGTADPLEGQPAAVDEDGPVDPFADLPAEPGDQPAVVPLRPGADGPVAPAEPAAQPAAPAAGPAAPAATPAAPVAPAAPQQTTTSGQAPSDAVPYTVGVGAFRSAENANRQADVFRQAGYPVVVAEQEDLTVILLGPYVSQTEAERVRNAVASGGFDVAPIVYTYQGDDAAQAPAAPAAPVETPAATPPPAVQQPTTPVAAPSATAVGRYLQVGAYSSTDNAGAQAGVLEGLGYQVVQQQDGQLIRVLVGPYPEPELAAAQNRLAAQGIDSVPR